MFSQPDWTKVLEGVAAGYGIDVRRESQLVEVDGDQRQAVILDTKTGTKETIEFAMLHAAPLQSAPDWVKQTPLADPASPFGYVKVDQYTLQSPTWPTMFALGDLSNLPTSKTGTAIRKHGPVRVANCSPPAAAGSRRPGTTATRPARWSTHTTGCCWPSSTTSSNPPRPSRSSTP